MWVQERAPRFPDNPGSKTKADKEIVGSRNVCLLDLLLASAGKLLEALETIILQSWPQKWTKNRDLKSKQHTRVGAYKK